MRLFYDANEIFDVASKSYLSRERWQQVIGLLAILVISL
jgi:hypothetical protein